MRNAFQPHNNARERERERERVREREKELGKHKEREEKAKKEKEVNSWERGFFLLIPVAVRGFAKRSTLAV